MPLFKEKINKNKTKKMIYESIAQSAVTCYQVYNIYRDILDSYVSDFYIENHWERKLSNSWKQFLENLSFSTFNNLLDYEKPSKIVNSPLSFLCLQKIHESYSISRKQVLNVDDNSICDEEFLKFFWKNIKLKKRHEIEKMSQICYQSALRTNCFNIVDVGSGLGHLSRMLAYQYGFNVCTIEANSNLTSLAEKLDLQFEKILKIKKVPHLNVRKPIHINMHIEGTMSTEEFYSIINKAFDNTDGKLIFGIVGLHPCGNLGSKLLNLYKDCSEAKFISIVSCCYMKLTLEPLIPVGFPLSTFYKENNFKLDYLSCETACHAIENYIEKIKTNNHGYLKIHSFRAALEYLLVSKNRSLKHSAVCNVKYEEGMSFKKYCDKALRKHKMEFCDNDLIKYDKFIEDSWDKVVKFYSVRLYLAPIVESIILYDRLLYLHNTNSECEILPAFDCKISPRNHVLSAIRNV